MFLMRCDFIYSKTIFATISSIISIVITMEVLGKISTMYGNFMVLAVVLNMFIYRFQDVLNICSLVCSASMESLVSFPELFAILKMFCYFSLFMFLYG